MNHQPPPRRADGRLTVTVTFLEMHAPPPEPPLRVPDDVQVLLVAAPPVHFYRYLYDTVGEPWLWADRRRQSDEQLAATIHDPAVDLYVLYVAGAPAGFAELDRRWPPDIELAYFGLLPDFIGRGLGGFLLRWAIATAWSRAPRRLWVHTCTLDHPRALGVYERAGFQAYKTKTMEWTDPRATGVIAAGWQP